MKKIAIGRAKAIHNLSPFKDVLLIELLYPLGVYIKIELFDGFLDIFYLISVIIEYFFCS